MIQDRRRRAPHLILCARQNNHACHDRRIDGHDRHGNIALDKKYM